jgi:enamine deaminase RidA (YjgF/YER057c/UK114 family)
MEPMSAEQELSKLKDELPPPPKAVGLYQPCLMAGNLCYTSGHISVLTDGSVIKGCVGRDVDPVAAQAAARQCGLAILATIRSRLGSLDRIKRVVKLLGFVNCSPDFTGQPAVMNGCSELMVQVFGSEAGVGVRSAVGTNALPLGALCEVEAVFEIQP